VPLLAQAAQTRSLAFVVVAVVPALRVVFARCEPLAVWSIVLEQPENSSTTAAPWVTVTLAEKWRVIVSEVVSVPAPCSVDATPTVSVEPVSTNTLSRFQVFPLETVTLVRDGPPPVWLVETETIRRLPAVGALVTETAKVDPETVVECPVSWT